MHPKQFILPLFLLLFPTLMALSSYSQSFKKLDEWMEANTPGLGGRSMLMIYKDGKIVYANARNEMSNKQKIGSRLIARRQGKPANIENYDADTRQPIASCSKWLSAALVMTFIDEGKLRLSDTVGSYLPVLSAHGKGNITISQCLSHLTGIKSPPLKENLAEMTRVQNMDEAMDLLAVLPMEGQPGSVFHYSNAGLQIAGAVLEKISGKSFQELFAERIAQPLGMLHTDFGKNKVALPAGGAISTPNDYINFLVMILDKGIFKGKRILSEKSIHEMQVNRLTDDVRIAYAPVEAGGFGYGFGEWIMSARDANQAIAISSPGLFGSFPWVDNQKHYVAFLMTYNIRNKGRNEKYQELKALVDETLP
ncbi:MAG TPA: serine hydrolase domain-containing protein [Flavisolibacter sp.]|nr:serine hydrolase domain-containing protein [Flavisolibacter sp.]